MALVVSGCTSANMAPRHAPATEPNSWERIATRHDALVCTWQWIDALERRHWPGTTGASQRAVAEALGSWGVVRGGIVFYASMAEIALEAGLSLPATRRAVRALCNDGLVRIVAEPTARSATVWRLEAPDPGVDDGYVAHGGLGDDWARWGGLGKRTARVWRGCLGGADVDTLAQRDGVHPQSIRRHLRRLRRHGMVEYDRQRQVWVACDADGAILPDRVAGKRARTAAAIVAARDARRSR
jgi:DNA-binding transcriptional ArsR family regulator